MPKRKTKSAAASTPAKSPKKQTSEDETPEIEKRGSAKPFCLLSSSHRQPRVHSQAGRTAPSKEQTINWLKAYEKKLLEDAERARKMTQNLDVLIELKQKKLQEWKEKETIVTNAAATDCDADISELLNKLGDQLDFDFVVNEEEQEEDQPFVDFSGVNEVD